MVRSTLLTLLFALACLGLAACGSAAELATSDEGNHAAGRSAVEGGAPPLTEAGGVVADAADLEGSSSADVDDATEVTLYIEPLCPHCKAFEQETGSYLNDLLKSGTITLEYRLVSFLDNPTTDRASVRTVNAAYCVAGAYGPAAFLGFVDEALRQQIPGGLTDSELTAIADDLDADVAECIAGETHADLVDSTTAKAVQAIESTPTVLIDGAEVSPNLGSLQQALTQDTNAPV